MQIADLDEAGTAAVEEKRFEGQWHREDDAAHEPGSPE
jgi:hypothetical protein